MYVPFFLEVDFFPFFFEKMEQSEPYKANQEKIQALDWKTQTDKQALKGMPYFSGFGVIFDHRLSFKRELCVPAVFAC